MPSRTLRGTITTKIVEDDIGKLFWSHLEFSSLFLLPENIFALLSSHIFASPLSNSCNFRFENFAESAMKRQFYRWWSEMLPMRGKGPDDNNNNMTKGWHLNLIIFHFTILWIIPMAKRRREEKAPIHCGCETRWRRWEAPTKEKDDTCLFALIDCLLFGWWIFVCAMIARKDNIATRFINLLFVELCNIILKKDSVGKNSSGVV